MDNLVNQKGLQSFLDLLEPTDQPKDEVELIEHDGMLFLGNVVSKERLETGLPNWKARNDDAFVVGYPKSGTTWTQEIAYLALKGGDIEKTTKANSALRVPLLEIGRRRIPMIKWHKLFTRPFKVLLFLWHGVILGLLRLIIFSIQQGRLLTAVTNKNLMEMMPSPRLMKSHLPERMLPPEIYQKRARIVYVMRNPKDVAVSYFHFHKFDIYLPTYESWDAFFDDFIAGNVVYGRWYAHVLGYWKRRNEDNILFLKYEDMKKDERAAVKQICEFLGYQYSDEIIDRIVQHTTFDNMKSNMMVNPDAFKPKSLAKKHGVTFMRKGIVGDWKNYFSDAQNKAIEDLCKEKFAGTGLTFDFE